LDAFASTFQATPGSYEALIVHPFTGQAVKVSFTLPEGAPRRVIVHRHTIEWDYGKHFVRLNFMRSGEVRIVQK
jgi:hypothetical protein